MCVELVGPVAEARTDFCGTRLSWAGKTLNAQRIVEPGERR